MAEINYDPENNVLDGVVKMLKNGERTCPYCVHFRRKTITCKAFPDQIPEQFATGEAVHDKPFPGDHGIRFEAKT